MIRNQSLVPKTLPHHVWVDAVCINQENSEEKSKQIEMMRDIYNYALLVIAWFGPDDSETSHTSGHLRRSWKNGMLPTGREWTFFKPLGPHDTRFIPFWKGITDVMQNSYWTRVWILQEVNFARVLWLMNGKHLLDFRALDTFVQSALDPSIQDFTPGLLWELKRALYIDAGQKVAFITNLRRKIQKDIQNRGFSHGWHSDLSDRPFLFEAADHMSTDARDKVFSLHGITGFGPIPNYSKSAKEVYTQCARMLVEAKDPDPRLLMMSGIGSNVRESRQLPSWVPG
jgi:hypothetical protein